MSDKPGGHAHHTQQREFSVFFAIAAMARVQLQLRYAATARPKFPQSSRVCEISSCCLIYVQIGSFMWVAVLLKVRLLSYAFSAFSKRKFAAISWHYIFLVVWSVVKWITMFICWSSSNTDFVVNINVDTSRELNKKTNYCFCLGAAVGNQTFSHDESARRYPETNFDIHKILERSSTRVLKRSEFGTWVQCLRNAKCVLA